MIVIELKAAINSAGNEQTFYLADDDFVTKPTDTPANIAFNNCVQEPGSIGVNLYGSGQISGSSALELGEVILNNIDGEFDSWLNYGFDGRDIVIRYGEAGTPYPAAWKTLLTGTMQGIEIDFNRVVIQLRGREYLLTQSFLTNRYAGTNSLPNGLEGTADDLRDTFKPKVLGKVFAVEPPMVNTSKLTFQVNDGPVYDIPAVYDGGLALTKGADYANSGLMQAASPAAGSYITCFAEGYFRLGSNPASGIKADVTEKANAADMTTAQLLKRLAQGAGLNVGAAGTVADIAALDAANAAIVGIWVNGADSYLSVMDALANSIGAYFTFDAVGNLRMGRLDIPSGTPKAIVYDFDTFEDIERRSNNPLPTWQVVVKHTKVWAPQMEFVGAVTQDRRNFLSQEYRQVTSQDLAVLNQFKLATPFELETLLVDATAAQTEAARQLAMRKVRRDVFDFSSEVQFIVDEDLELNDVVELRLNRFGLSAGKLFRIIGMTFELKARRIFLTLWG